jgi:hypothetical protein
MGFVPFAKHFDFNNTSDEVDALVLVVLNYFPCYFVV